ncbi:MFS transporter [Lolliginicoccus suaedae]|uniref:MFS transporter n=1 Tax=Lolliginicoccus suaedae TaxID=2605429 RepID=UPI001F345A17|nr:MFS transporter [Lolliginicoccus suaedae]
MPTLETLRLPVVVWLAALAAYVVAVLNRTSLGVAGLDATERYGVTASMLSLFVVLQVLVYAAMQIPSGLLLDRFGSRAMISAGLVIMAVGQGTLALSEELGLAIAARVLVGLGDALVFIAAIRVIPQWFPARQVPLLTQLTGILGQSGQVLSAVPLAWLLHGPGWSVAYASAAALSVLVAVGVLAVVRDDPSGTRTVQRAGSVPAVLAGIRSVWSRPGTRQGFYGHMGTAFSGNVFVLLWGFPFLVGAQRLDAAVASGFLALFVVATVAVGPFVGVLTGRYPWRREMIVLGIIALNAAAWSVMLLVAWPAPGWLIGLLVVAVATGGPGSVIGFDLARTSNPPEQLGLAQGMVNQGGFVATLVTTGLVGVVLTLAGGYTAEAFRLAWLVQFPVWAVAVAGVVAMGRRARAGAVPP